MLNKDNSNIIIAKTPPFSFSSAVIKSFNGIEHFERIFREK